MIFVDLFSFKIAWLILKINEQRDSRVVFKMRLKIHFLASALHQLSMSEMQRIVVPAHLKWHGDVPQMLSQV